MSNPNILDIEMTDSETGRTSTIRAYLLGWLSSLWGEGEGWCAKYFAEVAYADIETALRKAGVRGRDTKGLVAAALAAWRAEASAPPTGLDSDGLTTTTTTTDDDEETKP